MATIDKLSYSVHLDVDYSKICETTGDCNTAQLDYAAMLLNLELLVDNILFDRTFKMKLSNY